MLLVSSKLNEFVHNLGHFFGIFIGKFANKFEKVLRF